MVEPLILPPCSPIYRISATGLFYLNWLQILKYWPLEFARSTFAIYPIEVLQISITDNTVLLHTSVLAKNVFLTPLLFSNVEIMGYSIKLLFSFRCGSISITNHSLSFLLGPLVHYYFETYLSHIQLL